MSDHIKAYIIRYFSDELEQDQSLEGRMERAQLKKWLLDWAGNKEYEEHLKRIELDIKDRYTERCMEYVQTGGGWARIDE